MAAESMEVDSTHLHAGADRCSDAAGTATAAAGKRQRNPQRVSSAISSKPVHFTRRSRRHTRITLSGCTATAVR